MQILKINGSASIECIIKSKSDYFKILERGLGQADYDNNIKSLLFNEIYRYLRLLRKEEYLVSCKSDFLSKLYRVFTHYRRKNWVVS